MRRTFSSAGALQRLPDCQTARVRLLTQCVAVVGLLLLTACPPTTPTGPDGGEPEPEPLPVVMDAGVTTDAGNPGPEPDPDAGSGETDAGMERADAGKIEDGVPNAAHSTSAAGTATSVSHTMTLTVGAPLPRGQAESSRHRLQLSAPENTP